MNKRLRFIYIVLLLFSLSIPFVKAQTTFASEDELKKHAAKLFEEEEFEKATPLYSQLVSNYLKDANYNFRLGVCFLYTNADKEKSLPFLEFAINKPDVEKEVYYYLGKAYHLNYRFDDAIAQYQTYLKVGSPKNIEKFQVQRQIEMCVNGKKLLRNLSDLQVTEKKEMNKEDFFRSYDISSIGGKLLVKPDEKEFKTPLDKKKKEQSIIYLAKDKSQVYFSSYGLENSNGKDIYVINKLPSGEWDKSQALGNTINTKYDEDYPFLHPNGKVLYFSSKGHNSMGGYDIFKSKFNEETNTWNAPENMDFPINTPDDDILYVTDSSEKEAYFSSARSSVSGKISVYHINVDRKPIDVVIIKGNVIKNRNNQALDLKITVKDLASNTILGIYNSSAENGSYSIELPNGGSFSFTVEAAGFTTQSDVVIVPVQYKFNPMKQEISYDLVTGRLKIQNSFGGTNEDENYLLALNYIKNKSKLDVSLVESAPIDSAKANTAIDLTSTTQKSDTVLADKKLSNDDIIKIAYEDAKGIDTEAKELREQVDIALNLANQKNELAQNKSKEASSYMAEAKKTDDIVKKEEFFDKSDAASTEAQKLNQETVTAFNLAKKIDATAFKKQEEADVSQQYAKGLEAAIKSENPAEALAKMDDQEKKLEELSQANAGTSSISNSLKTEADTKQRELNKAIQASGDIKQEMVDNETVISNLKLDIEKTKNEELKKGLENQIAGLNQENNDKKIELKQNETKVVKLKKDYDDIVNETAMVNTVINQSKTESSEIASANVASIDRNKLEQRVNSIASVTSGNTTSVINQQETAVTTPTTKPIAATTPDNTKPTNTQPAPTSSITSTTKPITATTTDNIKSTSTQPEPTPITSTAKPIAAATPDNTKSASTQTEPTPIASTVKPIAAATADNTKSTSTQAEAESTPLASTAKPTAAATPDNTKPTSTQAEAEPTTITSTAKPIATVSADNTKAASTQAEPTPITPTSKPIAAAKPVIAAATVTDNTKPVNTKPEPTPITSTIKPIIAATTADNTKSASTKPEPTSITSTAKPTIVATTADNTKSTSTQAEPTPIAATAKPTIVATTADNTKSTSNKPETATPKTPDDALEKINKGNAADLAVAEKIENKNDREKAKEAALKMWAEEIDDHVAELQQDYWNTTDSKKKSLLALQIADAEKNSKEKYTPKNTSLEKPIAANATVALLPDEAFERKSTPVYSAEKPIPINNKLPEGLIYKVQIGAFSKPISQDLFVGISPITGETTPQGFIRYTAGIFKNPTTAENVKNEIKSLGYKDAFVVAFNNGKRIPLNQAYTTSGTTPSAGLQANQQTVKQGAAPVTAEELQKRYTEIASRNRPMPVAVGEQQQEQAKSGIAPTENVTTVGGLFYTVQIGVFAQTVPSSKLHNIQPLYTETAPNGNLRYNIGMYNNMKRAAEAKFIAIDNGFNDAFITAYYNGKRISMNQAAQYEQESGAKVFSTATNVNVLPFFGPAQKQNALENSTDASQQPLKSPTLPVINNEKPLASPNNADKEKRSANIENQIYASTFASDVVFKIQLGAFRNEVPLEIVNKFLKISKLGVENYEDISGLTIFTAGDFKTYDEAVKVKQELVADTFKDAFVVAYRNGKKISMEEAKK